MTRHTEQTDEYRWYVENVEKPLKEKEDDKRREENAKKKEREFTIDAIRELSKGALILATGLSLWYLLEWYVYS